MHRGARSLHLDICDYDKNAVCNLYDNQTMLPGQATDVFVHSTRQNGWKELTFKIPSTCFDGEEEVENFRLKYLVADYTIRLQTENEEDYYLISEPRIIHDGGKNVEVTAGHISQLLKTKNLNLEFSDQEGNNVGTAEQLLRTILKGTSWNVGNVVQFMEDDGVTPKVRSLSASVKTGAFMLVANLCEKFDAAPIYHGDTRTVDLVPLNPFSAMNNSDFTALEGHEALELRYGTNVSSITRTLNTENLVTRLYAYGSWGSKDTGMCSLQEVEHTEYKITLPECTEGTEYCFTDKYGDKKYFVLPVGWEEGDVLIYSDLDPSSRSYLWNENKEKTCPVSGDHETPEPDELQTEQEQVVNWVDYLMDFTYYDKIGLLTQEKRDTLGKFQRAIPALNEAGYDASLNLSQKETELSLLAESFAGFLRLDVGSYGTGDNGELVLNIDKSTYSDGVIYRSDYAESRKNYFSWYCARELKDNGDILSGPGSVVYIIHDTNPVTWEKAYVKLIDGEQKTQDYSNMSTDPDSVTLWINEDKVPILSSSDRIFLFAANSISGRLGVNEVSIESILQALEQSTKVVTQTHPTYFVWDNDPDPSVNDLTESYGWYYRTYSDAYTLGDLYFYYGKAGEANWHRVYLEEFEPEPVNGAWFYNLRNRQLYHGETQGQGTKWINVAELNIHVTNFQHIDVSYTAPDNEAKALSQAFSKVAMYCYKYDEAFKGLYDKYIYEFDEPLAASNYAIKCPFGYYWVFSTDEEIPGNESIWLVPTENHVHQSAVTDHIFSSEAKPYETLEFPKENILDGVTFKPGSIDTNGVEVNSDTYYRSYYISVYSNTDYQYSVYAPETPAAPTTKAFFYDVNKRLVDTQTIPAAGVLKTHERARYVRLVMEQTDPSYYFRVEDYTHKLFIKNVEYTILDPITTEGQLGGANNLTKAFADLADKCYYQYEEDGETKQGYLPILEKAQKDILDEENRLKNTFGDLYREGFWQKNDYVDGDEPKLYQDGLDNLTRISHPEATYDVQFIDLYSANKDAGCSVIEDLDTADWPDIEVTDAIHLIDEEIDENCWAYIDVLDKCYDQPWRTTLQVNTDLSLIGQRSFTDAIARIAQVSNETSVKQTLYERAANISGAGTMAADKLSGTINANRTTMTGGASNWYTDPKGNIVFESADGQSAMMLNGYGFCVANTKDKYGDWEFRTFGTGNGLVGDEIIGGTIYGSQIVAGTIEADALHASVGQTLEIGSNDALLLYATVDGFRPAGALETQVSEGDGTFHPVEEGDSYIKISSQEGQEKAEIAIVTGGQLNLQGATMNLTSASTMNLTSGDLYVESNGKIHMESGSEIELLSGSDLNVKSGGDINVLSQGHITVGSQGNISVQSGGTLDVDSQGNMNINSGGHLNVESQGNIHIVSGGTFTVASDKFAIDSSGNVRMNGTVTAAAGNIAGFTIDGVKDEHDEWTRQYLYAGNNQSPSASTVTNGVYVGTDGVNFGGQLKLVNNKLVILTDNFKVYDTGAVELSGDISATGGTFGGWRIDTNDLHAGSGTGYVALNSAVPTQADITANNNKVYAFWAGNETASAANFSVTKAGLVTAKSGKIANWNIREYQLDSGATTSFVALNSNPSTNYAIWAGRADAEKTESGTTTYAPFYVKRNGEVRATTGNIGGWTMTPTRLSSGEDGTDQQGHFISSYVALDSGTGTYAIWAGNSTAVSAPFSVTRAGAIKSVSGSIGGWNLSDNKLYSGSGNSYVSLDSTGGDYAIWAGADLANQAKFSVKRNGTVTATTGSIGGWSVENGILFSGSGTGVNSTRVALNSDPNSTYAIWAGDEVAANAPFRVERNGTVYLTKLYTVDSDGHTQKNVSGMLWKLYYSTVISCGVEDNVLTISLTNGDTITFKKAGEVDHFSGTVGVPTEHSGTWSASGTDGVATFSDGSIQTRIPLSIDVTMPYNAGLIDATVSDVSFDPATITVTETGTKPYDLTMSYKTYPVGIKQAPVSVSVNADAVYTAGITEGANRVTIGIASLSNIVLETGQKSGQRSTTLSYQITGASDSHTYGPMQIGVNATEIYNDGWKAANAKVVTPTSGGSSTSFVVKYPDATVDTQNQTTYSMSLDATPATTGYAYVKTGSGTVAQISIGGWYSAGVTAGANTVTIGRGSLTDIVLASGEKSGQRSTTLGYQISGASDSHSYGPMQIGVDATAIYTDGYAAGWAAAKAKIGLNDNKIVGPPDTVDGAATTLYTITSGVDSGQIYHSYGSTLYKCDIVGYAYIDGDPVRASRKQVQTTISS